MAKEIKTIGVLTSGGDAPGMNAAVRAIVRAGISKGYRMMGIQRGYNGLINGEVYEMNVRSVSEIIHRGGTILYTARCLEFKTKEGQAKGLARCKELGIDAPPQNFRLIRRLMRRQDFADIYLLTQPVDLSALVLQKEEVEAVKWASREEITEMVQSGEFHNYGKEYFDLLFSV